MSRHNFTLRVPADPPYQALASGVAGRYLETLGVDEAACAAFRAAVSEAVADLASRADAIDLAFTQGPAGVLLTLEAGGRQRVLSQSV
jgi:hypothetical protein